MGWWPFKRKEPEQLTGTELRDRLIMAAASGSRKQLLSVCKQFKAQVPAHLDILCKAPDELRTSGEGLESYIQSLGTVAQCLAKDCDAPELWNRLCGTPDSNPLLRWEAWYQALPERMQHLEQTALISEARQFIDEAKKLQGNAVPQQIAILHGRLGELLFHAGHVEDSILPFQTALDLCRQIDDLEGHRIYLRNLVEAHRYLGNIHEAIQIGEQGIALAQEHGFDSEDLARLVELMRRGEPRCRVVVVRDGKELELDEFSTASEGRYEFHFRRNRISLQMSEVLVGQGNQLASAGQFADALEKYQEAMEVDPHDPNPAYQAGMCLMELGAYGKAKEYYDEVEQLAPGWFRCRFDRWLAQALESRAISATELQLLRVLEDGGLTLEQAKPIALQAVADYPEFASFHLILGDIYRDQGENDKALACYREGISQAANPDVESRLLCAAAGVLPAGTPERQALVKRAVSLEGSLVAKAMAAFIPIE